MLFIATTGRSADRGDLRELFGFDKVRSAHLIFAPDQWEAIKPAGRRAAPEDQGDPGATEGPMMFSPGAMLVPGFLRELDSDKSGEISRDEFVGGSTAGLRLGM
jgi:hypothetical protein